MHGFTSIRTADWAQQRQSPDPRGGVLASMLASREPHRYLSPTPLRSHILPGPYYLPPIFSMGATQSPPSQPQSPQPAADFSPYATYHSAADQEMSCYVPASPVSHSASSPGHDSPLPFVQAGKAEASSTPAPAPATEPPGQPRRTARKTPSTTALPSEPAVVKAPRDVTFNVPVGEAKAAVFHTPVDELLRVIHLKGGEAVASMVKKEEEAEYPKVDVDAGSKGTTPSSSTALKPRRRGKKKHPCEIPGCVQRFAQRAHLKAHIRAHTGEKPFGCRWCPKMFTQTGNRTNHERRHTGDRPYKCSLCPKAFPQSSNLTAHMATHTERKSFVCRMANCDKKFTERGNLKAHLNRCHKYEVATWYEIFDAADGLAGLSTHEEDMLIYFAVVFKNSNRGTVGRHKHRVVSEVGVRERCGKGGETVTKQLSVPAPEDNMVAAQAATLPSPAPSSPATVAAAHMRSAASDAGAVAAPSPSARFFAEKQTLASPAGDVIPTSSAFSWSSFYGQQHYGQQHYGQHLGPALLPAMDPHHPQQHQALMMYHQFQPTGRPGMFHHSDPAAYTTTRPSCGTVSSPGSVRSTDSGASIGIGIRGTNSDMTQTSPSSYGDADSPVFPPQCGFHVASPYDRMH